MRQFVGLSVVLLVLLCTSGCAWWLLPPLALPTATLSTSLSTIAHPITDIPLSGPLVAPQAQLSGVAWYGDTLLLLPQYPSQFNQQLFALNKQDIVDFLSGKNQMPLEPWPIAFLDEGIANQIAGFNGYEAITFVDDQVYLTIEARQSIGTIGYLVSGSVTPELTEIRLDPTYITMISPQAELPNMSDEAIVAVGDQLATLYEANGLIVNREPVVHFFDRFGLTPIGVLPLTTVEYRITDATELDSQGRFWVINYFYPKDRALRPILRERGAAGAIDESAQPIERLLELQFTVEGVSRTNSPPVSLALLPDNTARNWEGIARLQTETLDGFLLVTDSFPETIFAFVSKAESGKSVDR